MPPPKNEPEFDPELVKKLSITVYKDRLGKDGYESMKRSDEAAGVDHDAKLAMRAKCMDIYSYCYLRAFAAMSQGE